jgi:glycosyltransferase involved in cell wall biosynthesis
MNANLAQSLVSVIISTHNRAGLLPEAIDSVLRQTYPHVEIIVVDDGSTDDTPAVAARYGTRIQYIRQKNAGVSNARNRGYMAARGEYIGFLDDDDVYFEDKLALQVAALQAQPEAPAANCNFYFMSQDGALLSHNGIVPSHSTFKNLLLANFIWMSGPLIRRSALIAAGLFAPEFSLAADLDMWLRLSKLGDFTTVQKPGGAYRIHQGSMATKADLAEADCVAVLQRAYPHLSHSSEDQKLRRRSEAQWRLWFGANYLNAGNPRGFTRNYQQAAHLLPEMFRDKHFMAKRLAQDVLNHRVQDNRAFCDALFAHLPDELRFVRGYREAIDERIEFKLAFDEITNRDAHAGKRLLKHAIDAHPAARQQPAAIRDMLFEGAMCFRDGAEAYLGQICEALPEDEPVFKRVLREVRNDAMVWEGCVAFMDGNYDHARKRMMAGIAQQPAWLKNRGVAKMLVQLIFARRLRPIQLALAIAPF